MIRIALVGPGAVGGVIAAWLQQNPSFKVVLCARRALPAEWSIETPNGVLHPKFEILTDPDAAEPVDWILVATKAYDSASAARWFPKLRGEQTRLAVLQNGVEHRERFEAHFPSDRIVPVMVDIPCERVTATHVRQRAQGKLCAPNDAGGRAFIGLSSHAHFDATVSDDFKTVVWRKLCLNCAGVISGLLLQPAGVMRDPALSQLARALVAECLEVARAEGANLDSSVIDWVIRSYQEAPPDAVNSLHADCAAGRPTEIDARNGVIVRLGQRHGIPTPHNQMAVTLIEAATRARSETHGSR
ncbi:MAG TPA: 2-dehydropantoate 2-reductase [Opitutaceae bacterium]|nr:2-dehydropantoate 2-reductase [Opitutaceae bacterium]